MKPTSYILLFLFAAALSLRAAPSVEQWGFFELALKGPANGNPFLDVKFSARFKQGTNSVEANGFYDGDGVYRVRFMPDKQGKWTYKTVSNARKLDGKSGSFTVKPPSPRNHGPVRVAQTYHFAYADGVAYEKLGTTCYVWEWQPEPLQEQTLKTLATSPFNKIRFCVFPKRYLWNTNEPILYPFVGEPATNWDFTRFNVKYFQHLEQRVLDLQKLGIEADIILFHPYDEGHWGFDRMQADVDDRYLRYVVARLAAYRNVWWSLANEWDFMRRKKETDFVRFGEIVSHDDPYHHLLSIHQGTKLFNHNLPWITHASIQSGAAVQTAARARVYRDTYHKPVVMTKCNMKATSRAAGDGSAPRNLSFAFGTQPSPARTAATVRLTGATTKSCGGRRAACSKAKAPPVSRFSRMFSTTRRRMALTRWTSTPKWAASRGNTTSSIWANRRRPTGALRSQNRLPESFHLVVAVVGEMLNAGEQHHRSSVFDGQRVLVHQGRAAVANQTGHARVTAVVHRGVQTAFVNEALRVEIVLSVAGFGALGCSPGGAVAPGRPGSHVPLHGLPQRDSNIHRLTGRGDEPLDHSVVRPGSERLTKPVTVLVSPGDLDFTVLEIDRAEIVLDRGGFRKIKLHQSFRPCQCRGNSRRCREAA
jgi:Domain of unknown function (DUF5060)/Protein of unknown function (DUF4038)